VQVAIATGTSSLRLPGFATGVASTA